MARSRTRLTWHGDAIKARVQAAAIKGVNETMVAGVRQFKGSHPGWQNRTGTAERSVGVASFAAAQGARVVGMWGSRGVDYFAALEFEHGGALRGAADLEHPKLEERIRRHYG